MMINICEELISYYDLDVTSMRKGRNIVILETDKGFKGFKEVKLHPCKIDFIYNFQKKLLLNGIGVDFLNKNIEENLYVEEDCKKYIVKDLLLGREISLDNKLEIGGAVDQLAKIHLITRNREDLEEDVKYDKGIDLCDKLARHNIELKRARNRVRKQNTYTDFEITFLESYGKYYQKAIKIVNNIMDNKDYLFKDYHKNKVIIHGQFTQHSVLVARNQQYFVQDFDYACYHLPIIDLYSFMRKVLEKNNWNVDLGLFVFQRYNKSLKLSKAEISLLISLLEYPEKFWKICNFYLNLNRAVKSSVPLDKLKKIKKQEESKEKFMVAFRKVINM